MSNKGTKRPSAPPRKVPAQAIAPVTASAPALPSDSAAARVLCSQLEKVRGRPALVYWTSDMARLSRVVELPLFDQLKSLGHIPHLDLVLQTNGGDTEAPWRVISIIREFAEKVSILIPFRATSAGTALALGADEIVMTALSTLGPIDPSRTHPLLPRREEAPQAEPISVQDMRHAMQFIRESGGIAGGQGYTPEAMAQIFTALFDKIHPLAIGAIEQSYALSKLIARKSLLLHMKTPTEQARVDQIVDHLCDEFNSHSYMIGRAEARELGLKVVDATEEEETILLEIVKAYQRRSIGPFPPPPLKAGTGSQAIIAWLDSPRRNFRVVQQLLADNSGNLASAGDSWVAY